MSDLQRYHLNLLLINNELHKLLYLYVTMVKPTNMYVSLHVCLYVTMVKPTNMYLSLHVCLYVTMVSVNQTLNLE